MRRHTPAHTKPFVFRTRLVLARKDVARAISTIEKHCRRIVDRTAAFSEIFMPKAKMGGKQPKLESLLPPKQVRLMSFREISLELDAAKATAQFGEKFLFCKRVFAVKGETHLGVGFTKEPDKEELFLSAGMRGEKFQLRAGVPNFSFEPQRMKNPSVGRRYVERLISLAALPVHVKKLARGYVLEGRSGASVEMTGFPTVEKINPIIFVVKFRNAPESKILDAFYRVLHHPEVKVDSWHCAVGEAKESTQRQPHESFLKLVKEAAFPTKNAEALVDWTIRSYREFVDMEVMAEKRRDIVGLSLMSFEFAKGHEAQVEIRVSPKKKYELWFSFDDPAARQ